MNEWLWVVAGGAAGLLQVGMLSRWVEARTPLLLLRIPLVAGLLVGAALHGCLGAAFAGWAAGFLGGTLLERRRR